MKIKLLRAVMLEKLDDPIEDNLIGHSRWALEYELIFAHEGSIYRAYYRRGADERPWEDEAEVECEKVYAREKMVEVWEPMND